MKKHILAFTLLTFAVIGATPRGDVAAVRQSFANPPDDARIMMRWWWFGAAVEKPELARELRIMKDAGIGGVEIQPVYPVVLDDPQHGLRNLPYLSDDFLDAIRFTAQTTRSLGMRMDVTLGSGWPYGGPHTRAEEAAGMLRCDRVPVTPGADSVALPALEAGESFIAAFLADGDAHSFAPEGIERLTDFSSGRVALPANTGSRKVVLLFVSSRTGQQVKRAALGAEGFVLDHYNRAAIENHLNTVANRLLTAFGSNPPHSVFSDSLEVYQSNWTADLLSEFQKRRGYDLTPYLPALIGDMGPKTADVRHDWGETLSELAEERYLTPIHKWAKAHGTLFRSQTYGIPPVVLSSNDLVDLPEGEGYQWRQFTSTRWATSASHLYGRPITSSETWTWLHSPVFRATPLDMKAEADLHFLQGVNQLIGHGWPYSPPQVGEPGWRFYAAAVFNNHNPWFIVMPDIARYLQRVSYLLRQGQPVNDVAVYLPTDDAWSHFNNSKVSVNEEMNQLLGPELVPQLLNAGYNFDFIDDRAIEKVGLKYPVVVLPKLTRMPEKTKRKLEAYKQSGGVVVDAANLGGGDLGGAVAQKYKPDLAASSAAIGFVHRKLPDSDVYFIANTSNQPVHTVAQARIEGLRGEWWNPYTGVPEGDSFESGHMPLDLAPYESRVAVFSHTPAAHVPSQSATAPMNLDVSSDWTIAFGKSSSTKMDRLHSWTEDPSTRFYSGEATYEKTVTVPEQMLSGSEVLIDFGPGTVPSAPRRSQGFAADLDSPIREGAVVYVNGTKVGSVWHPPYQLNIRKALHAGQNEIRIVVGNLALNNMAGHALPDYRLLNVRYGARFQAQDMQNVRPEPSGILGTVQLIAK